MAATGSKPIRFSGRGERFRGHVARALALCTLLGSGLVVTTLLGATPASAGASLITISDTIAGQATTDEATIDPFAGASINDFDTGYDPTVMITLSATANGTLSNLDGGSYNSSTGVYTVTGSASAVTSAVDGLVFTPTAHEVPPGDTVTTTFAFIVTDTAGDSASDDTTTVAATAVNDPPVITGARGGQATSDEVAITPFSGVHISDVDFGQTENVTITLSGPANGTLSSLEGGTYNSGTGVYTVSGTDNAVTTDVDGLVFTPTAHQVAPGDTVSTTFTVQVTDTAGGAAIDSATTVAATAIAADGSGAMSVTGSSLVASSAANILTFTYTAAIDGTVGGKVDVVVPADFGVPQTTDATAANYVSATGGVTVSISGQTIEIGDVTLVASGRFSLTIANLTAPGTAENETFATSESSSATDGPVALVASPSVTVTSPSVSVVSQSITFSSSPPNGPSVGDSYTPVAVGGASGNSVTFAIAPSSSSICALSGSTVSFTGAGSCVIEANQAGNADFAPAQQVTQSFVIAPAGTPTLSTSISRTSASNGTPVTFTSTVTTTSGTPTDGGTVTFSIGGATLCSAVVSDGRVSCHTTDLPRAGNLTVIAAFSGSANALPTHSTFSLVVSRGKVTVEGKVHDIGHGRSEYTTTVRAAHGGFGAPKGSIIFFSGTRAICSAPLRGDTARCDGATVHSVVSARYRPGTDYRSATKVISE